MAQRHGRGGTRGSGAQRGGARGTDPRDTRRNRDGAPAQRPGPSTPVPDRAKLLAALEPVVAAAGYDVEALSVSRAGRRHLVQLTVDRDGGVNLDAVADVSRLVSTALDELESAGEVLLAGEYELQVSSPGVDRPLTLPRHWRRNVGRLVQVRAGDRQLTARVLGADADGVVLGSGDGVEQEFAYDALGAGKVQLEFRRLEAISDEDFDELTVPVGPGDDDDDDEEDEE